MTVNDGAFTNKQQYREAKAIIEDPAHWCTDFFALNAQGDITDTTDPEAVRFCVLGACARAQKASGMSFVFTVAFPELEQAARDLYGHSSVAHVNNRYGHSAAIQMLDRAIELAPET